MSIQALLGKLEKLAARVPGAGGCRCSRPDWVEETTIGADETLLRARCERCGGYYLIEIIEVVVEPDANREQTLPEGE